MPPRTLEGLQLEEEPVYEAEPEPEPEPKPEPEPEPTAEPENDYEDVGDIDIREEDGEADGDYEDVLEVQSPSCPTPAGEWWGRNSS